MSYIYSGSMERIKNMEIQKVSIKAKDYKAYKALQKKGISARGAISILGIKTVSL